MKNITYYLGAGASAYNLPVLNEVPKRLRTFHEILTQQILRSKQVRDKVNVDREIIIDPFPDKNDLKTAETLSGDLSLVIDECCKHQTIDTLAKKYFLNPSNEKELFRLKNVISIYFLFEQLIPFLDPLTKREYPLVYQDQQRPDQRYDSFIASIIGSRRGRFDLMSNIKVLSWNYDVQFELAYREYNLKSIAEIHRKNQILPSPMFYLDETKFLDLNRFSLVRLNGIIGIRPLQDIGKAFQSSYIDELLEEPNLIFLCKIYSELLKARMSNDYLKTLSFFNYYWEYQDDYHEKVYPNYDKVHDFAQRIMQQTDALVVIGYSFPIFNREMDSKLLKSLPNTCNTIYVQDPNAAGIIERIKGVILDRISDDQSSGIKLIPIRNVDQFHLPDELNL